MVMTGIQMFQLRELAHERAREARRQAKSLPNRGRRARRAAEKH